MKTLVRALALGVMSVVATNSWANFLTNGDFESGPLHSAGTGVPPNNPFTIGNQLNKWIVLGSSYSLSMPGPSGLASDDYAKHAVGGSGSDIRLVQFISPALFGIGIGTDLELYFDYRYDPSPNAQANPPARVSLIGIANNRSYALSGGTGIDGQNFDDDSAVAAPDVLLATSGDLAFTNGAWSPDKHLSASIGANFFAIGVIVQSGCYDPDPTVLDCNNVRGFDNFELNALPAPEPATLSLLGLGLAGLGWSRRRTH